MTELTQETLNELLSWLSPDAVEAARKYKTLHQGLTKVLRHWGCSEAEELADETINRVAAKVRKLRRRYKGNPERYFFGVAKKVCQEYKRKAQKWTTLNDDSQPVPSSKPTDELAYKCFENCMQKLVPQQRELVTLYYRDRAPAQRERLARHLGITIEALRVRVFRIVKDLRKCAKKCVDEEMT
jgi:RNA polymerase sigma factor (sigma-70 family)